MKKKARRSQEVLDAGKMLDPRCVLCLSAEDDAALFGDKITLQDDKIAVHYFCLLTSCGVYQRGKDSEGIFGFLVKDIKQESRRSARLTCCVCKKKGACVGCYVKSCRKMVHFPCGRKNGFVSQFAENFPSYCPDHSPFQSLGVNADLSLPQSCSVCLDAVDGNLSYAVLKCPSCHASWFHRDCVQRQAHSAGLFFFRCTLCNNKDEYQQEMLRMGIYIPERDASWELETNAYADLLEVYMHCDAHECLCVNGRAHSAKTGWFQAIRCLLCGSRGTHRKCSGLKVDTNDWACPECTKCTDGKASLVASPQAAPRRALASKRLLPATPLPLTCKKPSLSLASPEELLQALTPVAQLAELLVEVVDDQVLPAALELVRRPDFDPSLRLSFRYVTRWQSLFPISDNAAREKFFTLMTEQIQESDVFEGPPGCKNLALLPQALRNDSYFDVGCLLSLSLVCGGPAVGFFSRALYQCLFNFPANQPLDITHLTQHTRIAAYVKAIAMAESLEELRDAASLGEDFLEAAGCKRPIGSLKERDKLVEDLVGFALITRMQLPLRRFREGLQTLGVFNQVQLFPSVFRDVFCEADVVSAERLDRLFTVEVSHDQRHLSTESCLVSFWRRFLSETEVGHSSVSLQDLLLFATGSSILPAAGLLPTPTISFLRPRDGVESDDDDNDEAEQLRREEGLFPQSEPESNRLLLPVISSSYWAFKRAMEQAISHRVLLLPGNAAHQY
nr:G2/M phase-specific E3 ubiquitin-protein ligase-like [Nerophis lumbriciformis]